LNSGCWRPTDQGYTTGATERSEVTIEPAHEALLRQWGLLRGWLEEDLGALTTLEGVKRAARDWAANARQRRLAQSRRQPARGRGDDRGAARSRQRSLRG
jgi:hypothetical protein